MLPGPFSVEMPEIYQIEVTDLCNFSCSMCPRTMFKRKSDVHFIDINLIRKLIDEGAFKGSYFVEFQMSGEPLLHPKLLEIIQLVKSTGVKVGLSTNGSLIDKQLLALCECDYITISVDSLSNYSNIRKNGNLDKLIHNIKLAKTICHDTAIDLQIVELPGWEKEKIELENMFPDLNVRTVGDCFQTIFHHNDFSYPVKEDVCLNPWLSVSIQCSGNVVPCCFSFWDDIIYGNIKDHTLKEIWESSLPASLRQLHQVKNYPGICARCYLRSPVLLHWNIFCNSMSKKGVTNGK